MANAQLDSKNFTKAQLDAILNAFYDVADVIDANNIVDGGYGINDASSIFNSAEASSVNFLKARDIVFNIAR